jgi:hypothetical protein
MNLLGKNDQRQTSNIQVILIILGNFLFCILAAGVLSGIYFFIEKYVSLITVI